MTGRLEAFITLNAEYKLSFSLNEVTDPYFLTPIRKYCTGYIKTYSIFSLSFMKKRMLQKHVLCLILSLRNIPVF